MKAKNSKANPQAQMAVRCSALLGPVRQAFLKLLEDEPSAEIFALLLIT